MIMNREYLPVQWVYREVIEEEIAKSAEGKIFYFDSEQNVCTEEGQIMKMEEVPGKGIYIRLDSGSTIRIDRIITLFGKPGAAYDEYDAYANACLACTGGYDPDDL